MKEYDGVYVQIQVFLNWALAGGEWSVAAATLPPGERAPGTHWILDPRPGLDDLDTIGIRTPIPGSSSS
jgi:hypothetical protein